MFQDLSPIRISTAIYAFPNLNLLKRNYKHHWRDLKYLPQGVKKHNIKKLSRIPTNIKLFILAA